MAGPWEAYQSAPETEGPWSAFATQADEPFVPQGPEQPDIGRGRALELGVKQGLTANFGDEVAGVHGAGQIGGRDLPTGLPGGRLVQTVLGAGRLGAGWLTGNDPGATEGYERARDQFRGESKTAERQYPGTSLAGNVAGAVANPISRIMGGVTLPARIGRSAAVGGAYGGLAGVGGGETPEARMSGGLSGLAVGAGTGAVATPVVEGVIQGARALGRPLTSMVRGALAPETEAARRVVGSIERDIANDPAAVSRLTPAEMMANRGQGATVMDMGGERTRAVARSAANSSPEGRDILNREINPRFEGQTARVSNWLRGAFHFPDANATQQAIEHVGRTVNRENYGRAYQQGSNGVWTPNLERLAGSDAVSAAMRKAATNAGDEAIVSGYGAMNPRVTFTQDGRIQFNRGPNGMPTYPDLQFWDLTRRELSDAAQRAGRGTSEARRLESFARTLNQELDRAVPAYNTARRGAAEFFGAENALEAGQNFVLQNFQNDAARQAITRMSPLERRLFQDGFVSRFIDTLEKTGDRRNILNKINDNPAAREKLTIALGPQRSAELEARLRIEQVMDFARTTIQGNSTTARQIIEWGLAGSAGAYGTYNLDPTAMTAAALLAGRRHVNEKVARRVAEMLVSQDPRVLQRGVQIVSRNNQFMEGLRRFDSHVGRIGGQQGTGVVPGLQGPMGARPEDEQ